MSSDIDRLNEILDLENTCVKSLTCAAETHEILNRLPGLKEPFSILTKAASRLNLANRELNIDLG